MMINISTAAQSWRIFPWKQRLYKLGAIAAIGTSLLAAPRTAIAAEKVVLTYGPFGRSITVDELEEFVETGRQTPTLQFLLKATKQNPEQARAFLSREVTVSPQLLDNILNILPGEYALFQVGRIFHTPTRLSNGKALRSSMILSTVDDRKISVMEFLRKYPTREFFVDGLRLANTARDATRLVNRVGDRLEGPIAVIKDLLDDMVCDCQNQ